MDGIVDIIKEFAGVSDLLQVGVLTVAVYYILNLFRKTRSAQMFGGLILVSLAIFIISLVGKNYVFGLLAKYFLLYVLIALPVIFQPEIRQTLLSLGRRFLSSSHTVSSSDRFTDQLVEVATFLSRDKTGALIAIEKRVHLDSYCENGTVLNAPFVPRLLISIFFHNAPLHDGGVILRGETIVAARCVFPLSENEEIGHGMRHRAALGLSEQTDAVVLVVSEETGDISIAYQGRFMQDLTPTHLRRYLKLLLPKEGLADVLRHAIDEIELERNPESEKASESGIRGKEVPK